VRQNFLRTSFLAPSAQVALEHVSPNRARVPRVFGRRTPFIINLLLIQVVFPELLGRYKPRLLICKVIYVIGFNLFINSKLFFKG
jgi:hypothetical protein